ncbi:uncharacterized protein V6R79_014229 [Siganus canaliculatus]
MGKNKPSMCLHTTLLLLPLADVPELLTDRSRVRSVELKRSGLGKLTGSSRRWQCKKCQTGTGGRVHHKVRETSARKTDTECVRQQQQQQQQQQRPPARETGPDVRAVTTVTAAVSLAQHGVPHRSATIPDLSADTKENTSGALCKCSIGHTVSKQFSPNLQSMFHPSGCHVLIPTVRRHKRLKTSKVLLTHFHSFADKLLLHTVTGDVTMSTLRASVQRVEVGPRVTTYSVFVFVTKEPFSAASKRNMAPSAHGSH